MVDPSAFFFTPSAEERIFASTPLGAQVTDPGMAATLGSAADVQRANVLLGKGLAQAQGAAASGKILGETIGGIQGAAASGKILGETIGGIGNILGSQNYGSGGLTGNPATSIFGGGLTGDPTTNILGKFFGGFGG
jgi:hypothetical protein